MKKTALLTLLCVLLVCSGYALEIKGKVVDPFGQPVAGAQVIHAASGAKAVTGAEGTFLLDIPSGESLKLEVSHPDFFPETQTVKAAELAKGLTLVLAPYVRQKEEVMVTALRYPETESKIPAAESVVTTEMIRDEMAPNIAEALLTMPGLSDLGSGGFSLVPSIRGLARNRILILVDGARVFSDRRTGPGASFVNPMDIETIEVLRSPSSVFYGSDAIGGVVHILTLSPRSKPGWSGRAGAGYGSVNGQNDFGLSLEGASGDFAGVLSFQRENAGNYSVGGTEILQSQFTQGSLLGKVAYRTEAREVELSFLGARGVDIGKPNRDSLNKPTWYPRENQNLAQLRWRELDLGGGELTVQGFLNPNFLETLTQTRSQGALSKESYSKTQSTDFGLQVSYSKKVGGVVRLSGGIDYFGRGGVQANNRETSFNAEGAVTKVFAETPYNNGRRGDLGFFVSADYSGLPRLDLIAGVRYDSLFQQANPGGGSTALESKNGAATGFLGASYGLTRTLVVFANISRAYRAPNLSERFYSGITGRGFIIAQPNLKSETSLNLDAGLKLFGRRLFAGFYGFLYTIDGMIERFLVSDRTYTYGNIDRGRVRGLELEVDYYPLPRWKVFGNAFLMAGKNLRTGTPLNDVPPARLFLGTRVWAGKFSVEVNGLFQVSDDDPGPAEVSVPGYSILNAEAVYYWNSTVRVALRVDNLFDKQYLARPDAEAMFEPGRNLKLGVILNF